MKKPEWKLLVPSLIFPLAVGGLSALITSDAMDTFMSVAKPPLSPPAWLFPVVWTILYLLMGYASYRVLVSKKQSGNAIPLYAVQLLFNFFWSIWFFSFSAYLFSFLWLCVLWGLILATLLAFRKVDRTASLFMLPYLLWVTFAGYLNIGIWFLNA